MEPSHIFLQLFHLPSSVHSISYSRLAILFIQIIPIIISDSGTRLGMQRAGKKQDRTRLNPLTLELNPSTERCLTRFLLSQKALGTLPEDGNVMPKHVGATIPN
jgi:hypothetical protein